MRHSTLLATILNAAPFVYAKCNTIEFNFLGKTLTGFDLADVLEGTNPEEGYLTTTSRTWRTSEIINCTKEAGKTGPCDFHHYPMVITFQTAVNETVDDPAQILRLIREKASPAAASLVNFNETVNWNFTVPNATIPFDMEANYALTPYKRCWRGRLGDCGDEDSAISGKNIEACGLVWREGTEGLPVDQQQYLGDSHTVSGGTENATASKEPQRPADEFDWEAYENEIREEAAGETDSAGQQLYGLTKSSVMVFGFTCAILALL